MLQPICKESNYEYAPAKNHIAESCPKWTHLIVYACMYICKECNWFLFLCPGNGINGVKVDWAYTHIG